MGGKKSKEDKKSATRSEDKAIKSSTLEFNVGNLVRVKKTVNTSNQGQVQRESVGKIEAVDKDGCATIKFPHHGLCTVPESDIEIVKNKPDTRTRVVEDPSDGLAVGKSARIKAGVKSPRYGWGRLSYQSVGIITGFDSDGDAKLDFPSEEISGFIVARDELEIVSKFEHKVAKPPPEDFKIGDTVRVRASATEPKYGWGDVTHSSVGKIVSRDRDGDLRVRFPEQRKPWLCTPHELEKVAAAEDSSEDEDEGGHGLKVGSKVRVKAAVKSPKFKWGGVSHSDVGTVIGGELTEGARVRVKPSVTEPKYKWGGVSHKDVGRISDVTEDSDSDDDLGRLLFAGLFSHILNSALQQAKKPEPNLLQILGQKSD